MRHMGSKLSSILVSRAVGCMARRIPPRYDELLLNFTQSEPGY
jgi:hypothetical protein